MMKKSIFFLLKILLIVPPFAIAEKTQWQYMGSQFREDYQLQPDLKAFYKIHRTPLTWFDARTRCDREGAELVAPQSHEEVEMLKTLLEKLDMHEPFLFLGIHSLFAKGRFVTLSDVDVQNLNLHWESGEPNNYKNNENCVTLNYNGRLSDTDCNDVHPFVCKKVARNISWNNECYTYDQEYKLDSSLSTCYKLHTQPKNWTSAYDVCESEGGHLAIINSVEEKNFLVKLLGEHPPARIQGNFNKDMTFLGFHDLFVSREFRTITGETLQEAGYNEFAGNQPDNVSPGEHCGAMFRNGQLDDLWCDRPYLFICERSNELRERPQDPFMKHFSKELVYIVPA
uniref:Immulectin 7 n=1 Tax=Hepialus xiaojinensis TaxID=1589740 RepID=A0A219YXH1_9NEOP|nr:immulectin 7 [Hepialus xiaojinensis]